MATIEEMDRVDLSALHHATAALGKPAVVAAVRRPRIHLAIRLAAVLGMAIGAALPAPRAFAGDCNGNGVPDEADIAGGVSADCDQDGVPDDCEGLPLIFGSLERLALPGVPGAAAAGDLDGDGLPELAAAILGSGARGVATILDPVAGGEAILESLATGVRDLDRGDLDGDGDLDLALARSTDIRIFLNSGDGRFPDRSYVADGGSFTSVRIGDLDSDGVNDVVAARGERAAVAVFRGLGGGAFAAATEIDVGGSGGMPWAGLALLDLDADGDPDVLAMGPSGAIARLRNLGGGELAAPAPIPAAGTGLRAFSAGDLDGDGLPDLAAIDASRLIVLVNGGDGSFEPWGTLAAAEGAVLRGVTIGDPDGDGRRDVVLTRAPEVGPGELQLVRVVAPGGAGGGAPGMIEPTLPVRIGIRPGALLLLDLDGRAGAGRGYGDDGAEEIVVFSAETTEAVILRRRGAGLPPLSLLSFETSLLSTKEFGNFEPHLSFLADLNGDGLLDLATMDGEDRVMVLANQGDGTQGDETIYTLRDADELICLAPADLDGDGDLDIAAVDERTDYLLVLRNDGDGTFVQTSGSYPAGFRPYFVVAADLDGDGDLDLVTANESDSSIGIFRNRGDATFDDEVSLPVGSGPVGLVARDLDGDGDPDLAVGKTRAADVTLLFNDGEGSFGDGVDLPVGAVSYLSGADLDGDGDIDLVAAQESEGLLTVLENLGPGAEEGTFEVGEPIDVGQPPRSAIAADLDGDSLPELVTGNEDTNTISILRAAGDCRFAPASTYAVGRAPRFVAAGDLDRNGRMDLVVANHTSYDLTFFFNESEPPSSPEPLGGLCTEFDYSRLALPQEEGGYAELAAPYLVPAQDGAPGLLPTTILPGSVGLQAWETLGDLYPERFGGLSEEGYLDLVGRRGTRRYFSGSIARLRLPDRVAYGFTIVADAAADPTERVALGEAARVHAALSAAFRLAPFAYFPDTEEARADARSWREAGFPILLRDPPVPFLRGDADGEGDVRLTDAPVLLSFLFLSGDPPPCFDAADANDDGELDISDAVTILLHLFAGAGALPPPSGACGFDETDDALSCVAPGCE